MLALWASLATLTRPDGLLAWAATALLVLLPDLRAERPRAAGRWLAAAAVSWSLVPLHFLWRRFTYGEWLPNTYYAKHVAPWPEAGLRYLGCFLVEYGYWACGLLAIAVLVRQLKPNRAFLEGPGAFRLVAVGTFVAHTVYYVLRVGGDHFEYRVLSEWVPLLALGWAFLLVQISSIWLRLIAIGLSLLAAFPIQWAHFAQSRVLTTRSQTWKLKVKVAPVLGPVFAPLAQWFDQEQDWLIEHHVGMRHQEHKVFGEEQRRTYPARHTVDPSSTGIPVIALTTVGVPGWAFPNLAVIDLFGLNDYVIARNPVAAEHFRLMAHDRAAPPGYVDCFHPNVAVDPAGFPLVRERFEPLTATDVRDCERDFLAFVQGNQTPLPAYGPAQSVAVPLSLKDFETLAHGPGVLLFQDFEGESTPVERQGLAFGEGPTSRRLSNQQPINGVSGRYLNSYYRGDISTGSVSFALPKGTRRVALKVAGGVNCESVYAAIVEGNRVLAKACGSGSEDLQPVLLTVDAGENLRFVAFDGSSEGWGHLIVDDVVALGLDVALPR